MKTLNTVAMRETRRSTTSFNFSTWKEMWESIKDSVVIDAGLYGKLVPGMDVAYTHSGIFHADDVASSALLKLLYPELKIVRVFKVPEDAPLAFDIGQGAFDHHQADAELRPDGNKYAAFGLLWRALGPELFKGHSDVVESFDSTFVREIDYTDNTGCQNPLSAAVKAFNPAWDSEGELADPNHMFNEAVTFVMRLIDMQFSRIFSSIKAESLVEAVVEDIDNRPSPHSILLEQYVPHDRICSKSDVEYVLFPSNREPGAYNISVVPKDLVTRELKSPLPESWVKNKPDGCTFCHTGLFMAAFSSREAAIEAVRAIDMADEPKTIALEDNILWTDVIEKR